MDILKEYDIYFFCNINQDNDVVTVYACVYANYIQKMLVRPFAPKLKDIKRCIMQDTCSISDKEYPCGITTSD